MPTLTPVSLVAFQHSILRLQILGRRMAIYAKRLRDPIGVWPFAASHFRLWRITAKAREVLRAAQTHGAPTGRPDTRLHGRVCHDTVLPRHDSTSCQSCGSKSLLTTNREGGPEGSTQARGRPDRAPAQALQASNAISLGFFRSSWSRRHCFGALSGRHRSSLVPWRKRFPVNWS